jgi:small GTP-binding protein
MSTLGVDFKFKEAKIGDKTVQIQIWDTAGQERFRNITKNYYTNANGVVIVFDVTHAGSYSSVANWIQESSKSTPQNSLKVLVANKTDMTNHRVISEQQGRELSQQFGLHYFETSAKDDLGVNEVFDFMANRIVSNIAVTPDYLSVSEEILRKKVNEEPSEKKKEEVSVCVCCTVL